VDSHLEEKAWYELYCPVILSGGTDDTLSITYLWAEIEHGTSAYELGVLHT